MRQILYIHLIIIIIIVQTGCQSTIICNSPYIRVGTTCCLDQNTNKICDNDENTGYIQTISHNNNTTLTATEIYNNIKESVYFLEVNCSYEEKYRDFNVELFETPYEYDFLIKPKIYVENKKENFIYSGSGFLFNKLLYTNYHVIDCNSQVLQDYYFYYFLGLMDLYSADYLLEKEYLDGFIETDIDRSITKLYRELDYLISKEEIESYLVLKIAEYLMEEYQVREIDKSIKAYHISDNFHSPINLQLMNSGASFPGKDFAVFNISTKQSSLVLADDASLNIGNDIYVVGFPELQLETINYSANFNSLTKEPPVITKGIISSQKKTNSETSYYVIDAVAYYGSSGGPVINQKGKVVGILTAGLEDGVAINYMLPMKEIIYE